MKTTPIYILILAFFLNFDLAWGQPSPLELCGLGYEGKLYSQLLLSGNKNQDDYFNSLNYVIFLNEIPGGKFLRNNPIGIHRLRFNIGLSKILTELDYEVGFHSNLYKNVFLMPYFSLGTSIYSLGYGGGVDLNFISNDSFIISSNINYRNSTKLMGNTDAYQWYQSGFGAKLGVSFVLATYYVY